jgi:hypothetical protein
MVPYMEISIVVQYRRHVLLDMKYAAAGWTDNDVIGPEQLDKMAAYLDGLLLHAGIGQGLATAGLIVRGGYVHAQLLQQQEGVYPNLRVELVNVTRNKQACLHTPKVSIYGLNFVLLYFFVIYDEYINKFKCIMMKNLVKLLLLAWLLNMAWNPDAQGQKNRDNQLSKAEKNEGWILMFNGKDTEHWRGWQREDPPGVWSVKDGTLYCKGMSAEEAGPGQKGDIMYDEQFSNFHLKVDWKISEGGNSGIFYLGAEEGYESIVATAPEMQVLDNERHPDAKKGKNGNRKAGALYDLIPAVPQNARPAGEWNSAEVIVKDGHLQHIQNGEVVVSVQLWTDEWKELVSGSKFPAIREDWYDVPRQGYIVLQDHGNDVWFKNIKIRKL